MAIIILSLTVLFIYILLEYHFAAENKRNLIDKSNIWTEPLAIFYMSNSLLLIVASILLWIFWYHTNAPLLALMFFSPIVSFFTYIILWFLVHLLTKANFIWTIQRLLYFEEDNDYFYTEKGAKMIVFLVFSLIDILFLSKAFNLNIFKNILVLWFNILYLIWLLFIFVIWIYLVFKIRKHLAKKVLGSIYKDMVISNNPLITEEDKMIVRNALIKSNISVSELNKLINKYRYLV